MEWGTVGAEGGREGGGNGVGGAAHLQTVGLDVSPEGVQHPGTGGLLEAQHSREGG